MCTAYEGLARVRRRVRLHATPNSHKSHRERLDGKAGTIVLMQVEYIAIQRQTRRSKPNGNMQIHSQHKEGWKEKRATTEGGDWHESRSLLTQGARRWAGKSTEEEGERAIPVKGSLKESGGGAARETPQRSARDWWDRVCDGKRGPAPHWRRGCARWSTEIIAYWPPCTRRRRPR